MKLAWGILVAALLGACGTSTQIVDASWDDAAVIEELNRIGTSRRVSVNVFPGAILVYHAISFWAWTGNQRRAGHVLYSNVFRFGWIAANLATGLLTILVAWSYS